VTSLLVPLEVRHIRVASGAAFDVAGEFSLKSQRGLACELFDEDTDSYLSRVCSHMAIQRILLPESFHLTNFAFQSLFLTDFLPLLADIFDFFFEIALIVLRSYIQRHSEMQRTHFSPFFTCLIFILIFFFALTLF
jgi:hypothetical protein